MKKFNSIKQGPGLIYLLWIALVFFSFRVNAQSSHHEHGQGVPPPIRDEYTEDRIRNLMKSEGIPDATIEVLIKQRKEFYVSGRKVEYSSYKDGKNNSLSLASKTTPVPFAACSDMGAENGWGSWQAEVGTYAATAFSVGALVLAPSTPSPPRFNLTSGTGIDMCTPGINSGDPAVPVVAPGFGNASIQLGQPNQNGMGPNGCYLGGSFQNGCAEQLTYVLNVTPADTNFIYAYAAFIDEPIASNPHNSNNTPYVQMCIYDSAGNQIPCGCVKVDHGSAANGFYQSPCISPSVPNTGAIWYKPWAVGGINLSQYIGQALTVVLTNVDCAWGGHFAYSYWDFTCQPPPTPVSACSGQTISLCANPPMPGNPYTYQWYQNGVPYTGLPNGTSQCITPILQQGDTFVVEIQQPSGCNFKMLYPTHAGSGIANFSHSGSCQGGGQVSFTDQSTNFNPSVPFTSWNWSFPGGTPASSTSQNPGSISYPPGTFTVTLIVSSAQGCPDTIQQTVTIGGAPTAAFSPTVPCLGGTTQLLDGSVSSSGDPIVSWSWNIPGGTPSSSSNQNTSTVYGTPGAHIVMLVVTTQGGCKDTISQQVLVYNPPTANFSGPITGCLPVCNNYSDLSASTDGNITSWQWSFPGGSPSSSTIQNPQNICYNTAGTYSASLIITSSYGCSDTVAMPVVEAYPWPTAEFCVSPSQAPATDPVFSFCDLWSSDVVQWSWDFGDGNTNVSSTDPVHSYAATSYGNDFYSYNICLNVLNQYGCWDSVCHPVELVPEFTFYIPNTFTPNGDFLNEDFFGKSRGVKDYNIWLFDRWGNLIWDCHYAGNNTDWDYHGKDGMSSTCKWDGIVDNQGIDMNGNSRQLVQEDVYVWKVKLTDIFDRNHDYIGHVSVVR